MVFLLLILALDGQPGVVKEGPAAAAARLLKESEQEVARGDYTAAVEHARAAADMFGAASDPGGKARALNRVGRAALYAGQYGVAIDSFRAAADLSAAGGNRDAQAEQLANLGNAYFFTGRYSDAALTYDAALTLVDEATGAAWAPRRRQILLVNKASLYFRLGRDQQALEIYRELETAGELPPDEQGQLLTNRGALYRRLGDPVKALDTYDAARRLFARRRNIVGELGVIRNRGIVFALDLQQLDAAEQTFSDVVALATRAGNQRELLHGLLYRGETRLRAEHAAAARADFERAASLARHLETPEEEWKALYGLGRVETEPARVREYLAQAVGVIERIREEIRVPALRVDFFNDKAEVFDGLIAAHLPTASAAELFGLVERSHSRTWRERLGLASEIDLSAVQAALPEGTLLLDYWSSARGSALIAATRARAALLPITVDDAAVRTLIETLDSPKAHGDWRAAARTLGTGVLPPAEWFNGVRHLIVVPSGTLSLVPFELLSRGEHLVIEAAAVTYTPTAATLLRAPLPTPRWSPPWTLQLRAFGDPTMRDAAPEDAGTSGSQLPSSSQEVRAIAAELSGRAALYLGPANLKAHLFEETEHAPVLHIASHAAADTSALEQSRIVFSPAAASRPTADYLFLREAYDLPLDEVELAVLSACDTERGRLLRGEGVQSFSRAFLAAGARSTVTTLWAVADAPTANFMEGFYHHLQRGLSRDEALRQAKLRFLASGSSLAHPHYWAAFVLTGDGLSPIPRALPWTWVAGAMIAIAAIGSGAARYRRIAAAGRGAVAPTRA
jgi:tetratricopeptide (TPR) repeat protein